MYIVKTTTKKSAKGTPYPSYRIVMSERVMGKVKQRTLLNIGSHFELPQPLWSQLCQRIDAILHGRLTLLPANKEIEKYAQKFAARMITERSVPAIERGVGNACHTGKKTVENSTVEMILTETDSVMPRSVGVEHVSLHAAKQLQLHELFENIGFTQDQITMALAIIVARMSKPGSEQSTWKWLTKKSALDELLNTDFSKNSHMSLYRISDKLIMNKEVIESQLYSRIASLFSFNESIILYDLTNTYFDVEGKMEKNENAKRGHSKEKRTDCPLLTLGLVLEGGGFVKRSKMFRGNISEYDTLATMLRELGASENAIVVLDRGIASKENLQWLVSHKYRYVVVSKENARVFDINKAQTILTAQKQELFIHRELNKEKNEAMLYCYSPQRAEKEQAIVAEFTEKFEAGIQKLSDGLTKPRTIKLKDNILRRIGRLEEQSKGVSQHYTITVSDNAETKLKNKPLLATSIQLEKKLVEGSMATHPGVYCIRTNVLELEAEDLWRVYIMLTDIEAVFRSLKSELGLRPVYHQTSDRAEGHLFISVLAFQCVQVIRKLLKEKDIHDSWETLRDSLGGQRRVTYVFHNSNGATLHLRKATKAEADEQQIYGALNLNNDPGGVTRCWIY